MRVIPARWLRRSRRDVEGTMTLVEHLEELRYRLVISIVAIAFGGVIAWFLFDPVVSLLRAPYCDYWETVPESIRTTEECTFFFSGALEPALIKFKLVGYMALFFALPVVLYQLWGFVVPGLTKRERRLAIPFVASSVLLFALGALFAYLTLPRALQFLLGFAGEGFSPLLTGDRFFSFVVLVALSFGLSFEFPVVLVALQMVGALSSQRLRSWRRQAVVIIVVFAAVLTPSQDPYTLLAMSIPMYIFYEASILIGRLLKK